MSLALLTFRLLHVVLGILWVGFAVFVPLLLGPALQDVGPDGAKVMGALQRRGLMTILPALGVLTLLSGLWLYWHVSGGFAPGYMGSRMGMALGTGAVFAVAGFVVGVTVLRPTMIRVLALAQGLPGLAEPEKAAAMATMGALRARGALAGRVVATLLLLASAAMAVARYV